ncbi:transglycosylase domain-containing protein [Candidatus Peregrinibacteria bacterium]|nr:transglycosylase domain-containing protein [Candidatus Peregrinibacteria bacterium]
MVRLIKIIVGILLALNMTVLVLFFMPASSMLRGLDYSHSQSTYVYVPLNAISTDAKKIFWQTAGDAFFDPKNFSIDVAIPLIWQDPFKRKSQKRFNQAQSQLIDYLLNYGSQESWWQKLQATFLVVKLNKFFKPDKIFEVYLNMLPVGQNVYGIGDASRQYFEKLPTELTREEAAYLVALSQFGSHYDPWRDPPRVQEIQREIIKKLQD